MEYFGINYDAAPGVLHAPKPSPAEPSRGWGWRLLPQFKTMNGKRYQLHATRGWKCIGRAA